MAAEIRKQTVVLTTIGAGAVQPHATPPPHSVGRETQKHLEPTCFFTVFAPVCSYTFLRS
jgi:hypothetical protein